MAIIALDVGDKTIGVAASDDLGMTAQGIGTVWRKGDKHDFPALAAMIGERMVDRYIVGWPLNMDDSEGPRALKTRRFAQRLRERTAKPVLLWDERLSTFEADEALKEGRVRADRRKEHIDMLAAQFILRSYLEAGAPSTGEEP